MDLVPEDQVPRSVLLVWLTLDRFFNVFWASILSFQDKGDERLIVLEGQLCERRCTKMLHRIATTWIRGMLLYGLTILLKGTEPPPEDFYRCLSTSIILVLSWHPDICQSHCLVVTLMTKTFWVFVTEPSRSSQTTTIKLKSISDWGNSGKKI